MFTRPSNAFRSRARTPFAPTGRRRSRALSIAMIGSLCVGLFGAFAPSLDGAEPTADSLPNGLRVIAFEKPQADRYTVRVIVPAGRQQEPTAGLAGLTADLVAHSGTRTDGSAAVVGGRLRDAEVVIETEVGLDRTHWTAEIPASNFDATIGLIGRLFAEPDRPDFEAGLGRARARATEPDLGGQFERAFLAIVLRNDTSSRLGFDSAVELDDVVAFFIQWFRPEVCTVVVTGPRPASELSTAITKAFEGWVPPVERTPWNGRYDPAPPPTIRRLEVGDSVGRVRLGRSLDPRQVDLVTAATVGELWRVKAGEAALHWRPGKTVVTLGLDASAPGAGAIRAVVQRLIDGANRVRGGEFTDDELARARAAVAAQPWFGREAGEAAWVHALRRCRPSEVETFFEERKARLDALDRDAVREAAGAMIDPASLHLLVVGPGWIESELESFGVKVEPVERFVPAEYPRPGRPLLDRVVAAAGGEALASLRSLSWSSTERNNSGGQVTDRPVRAVVVFPDRMRVDYPTRNFTVVLDRGKGWRSVGGEVVDMTAVEVEDFERSLQLATTPLLMNHEELQARELEPVKRLGVRMFTLEVTRPGVGTVTLYVDQESFLILEREHRQVTAQGVLSRAERLQDYREVGGYQLPFRRLLSRDGEMSQRIDTHAYEIDPEIPDSTFRKPEDQR